MKWVQVTCTGIQWNKIGITEKQNYLKFWTWNEARSAGGCDLSCLPPVVVVLADDLENISCVKRYSSLCTWYQVIIQRIILKLCPDKYVTRRGSRTIRRNNLGNIMNLN
jgi:hypothetical protein